MRTLRYYGNKDLRLDDTPHPNPPGPDEIQIEPEWSGICGTDIHEYLGGPIMTPVTPHALTGCTLPVPFGHEAAGVITAVGSNVTTHKPGDKVFINPTITCGKCYSCVDLDSENVCETVAFVGLTCNKGAFTEVMNLPAHRAIPIPQDLLTEQAAVLEPVMVAYHAARRAGITKKSKVHIVGGGPVGLGMLLVCKEMGVGGVILSEIYPLRKEMAQGFDADMVLDPTKDDAVAEVRARFDGLGADVAFDISGNAASLSTAIRSTRIRGTIVPVALFEGSVDFNINDLLFTEKHMLWPISYTEADIRAVIQKFGANPEWREKVKAMITLKCGLSNAVDSGFDALINHRDKHVKVLITAQSRIMP